MITPEQEKWIETLSDNAVRIVPYDNRSNYLFNRVKKKIHNLLGSRVIVEHCGVSSFGISGQDEIDVSIVVKKDKFDTYIPKLETEFGSVRSRYVDRARFEVREEGKKIDLKLVDIDHPNYINSKIFETHLRSNPEGLERYRILKEETNGVTVKEYYRTKIDFINNILLKAS